MSVLLCVLCVYAWWQPSFLLDNLLAKLVAEPATPFVKYCHAAAKSVLHVSKPSNLQAARCSQTFILECKHERCMTGLHDFVCPVFTQSHKARAVNLNLKCVPCPGMLPKQIRCCSCKLYVLEHVLLQQMVARNMLHGWDKLKLISEMLKPLDRRYCRACIATAPESELTLYNH